MAWYPGARKLELQPESDSQPAIRPTQFIMHSIVAPWDEVRTYEYWRDSTNLESHFGLDYDGSMGQYIGTETRADANYRANRRSDGTGAVSIETASNTKASDAWTPEQTEALIKLGVWLHKTHGIPLRICRAHDDPGFGYHSLHGPWSVSGTACPGPARIKQFRDHVFPQIVARATGQEDAMSEETERKIASLHSNLLRIGSLTEKDSTGRGEIHGAGYYLAHIERDTTTLQRQVADLATKVDQLQTTGLTGEQIDALAAQLLDRMSGRLAE